MIGVAYQGASTQLTLPLRVLRGKDVALESLGPFDLAGPGLFEPFGCAFVCFQFRHCLFFKGYATLLCFALALRSRGTALASRFTRFLELGFVGFTSQPIVASR